MYALFPCLECPFPCIGSFLCHSQVVDHYENPINVGSLDKNAKNVGTGLVGAPACGDVMKLQIQVDEKGKIVDASVTTFGCGSAIASSSLVTEWVKCKSIDEALEIKNTDIAKELCLPPVKLHCSIKHVRISDGSCESKSFAHLDCTIFVHF
uniref:Iron-sulfur cluster assembly enzyme ISCU n=1 Tax=Oncorhynchus tshawytscha TaxID=74940 RepID=A0A8C8GYY7_ONCTS